VFFSHILLPVIATFGYVNGNGGIGWWDFLEIGDSEVFRIGIFANPLVL